MPAARLAKYVGAIVLAVASLLPPSAAATDQPISGRRLLILESTSGGRLVFLSKDAIVAPTPGGGDDPRVTGATLKLTSGSSAETTSFDLPAANWTASANGSVLRYRNPQAPGGPSPVDLVLIKSGKRLKVTAKTAGLTLDEPSQGSVGLELTSGSRRYLALFGGLVVRDEPTRFLARNAPAPPPAPSLQVQITSPADGALIQESVVQVRGTVSGASGAGVVVNGTQALVQDGAFVVDGVPLTTGANVLTATAAVISGQTAMYSVNVTSNGAPPALVLVATPDRGIQPLSVTFTYERTSTVGIQTLEMDWDGDGTFDLSTTNPADPLAHDYQTPGLYLARLRLTDTANVATEATAAVAVDNVAALDALLRSLWDGMNGALAVGDPASAADFLTTDAQERYGPVWSVLLADLPAIVASYSPVRGVFISGSIAEYAVNRTLGGENYLFLVYFVRGPDGVWRIDAM